MQKTIASLLQRALETLYRQGILDSSHHPAVRVEYNRNNKHGDLATNAALVLAKSNSCPAVQLAETIVTHIPAHSLIDKVSVAGNGFINFHLHEHAWLAVIPEILQQGQHYGDSDLGAEQRVLIEFVSANPTGPLHVGHGRGATLGSTLCNILRKTGHHVECEYYVNDAGRQMDILTLSVWLRYLQQTGETFPFPENAYQGDYVVTIAATLYQQCGKKLLRALPGDCSALSPEEHLDMLIAHAREVLGESDYNNIFQLALQTVLTTIRADLADFHIHFDHWYHESSLANDAIKNLLQQLQDNGYCYEKENALWFRASHFGDEKDRVLLRSNGQLTYFATDIAYHVQKLERNFTQLINVWGADHHGYGPRLYAALQALDKEKDQLQILFTQFASLFRGKEKVAMSTRSGQYVTLAALRTEIGVDAARFFYVMHKSDQHLNFDLQLATSKNNENPVYYVQYAHARICSVMRKLKEQRSDPFVACSKPEQLSCLHTATEKQLIQQLHQYPIVLEKAAKHREPHQLVYFLKDLATHFHALYNELPFLVADIHLRNARLSLICACREVLHNGLTLLGVSAPEEM